MFNNQKNHQSPEAIILRFMREKRKLTILEAGKRSGIKPKNLDYMENGKRVISDNDIKNLLNAYQFSINTFQEMIRLKILTKIEANHYFIANDSASK